MAKFLANFLGPFKIYFDFGYFYQKLGKILTKPSGHTAQATHNQGIQSYVF